MKVFVVIATYNASRWLAKCLNSVLSSSVPLNVIIVDNDSTDDTTLIAETFPDVKIIRNKRNLGFGSANNIGIEYAVAQTFDFVLLLNQDAYLNPDTVELLIEVSKKVPEYAILSPIHLSGNKKQLDLKFSYWASPGHCRDLFSDYVLNRSCLKDVYETSFVNAAIWLLPFSSITLIGGFDPLFYHYGEDDDYINRIHYHGYKVGICPASTAVHDRIQVQPGIDFLKNNQVYNRMKVDILLPLKKLANKFHVTLLRTYILIGRSILVSAFKLNAFKFKYNLKLLVFLTLNIRRIYRSRKISEKAGTYAFLR